MFSQWEKISIAEIVYYSVVLVVSVYPMFKLIFIDDQRITTTTPVSNFKPFIFRYLFIIIAKIVSGILLLIYIPQLNRQILNPNAPQANSHIFIGSIVLNSISFGLMNISNLIIVQYIDKLQIYLTKGDEFKPWFKFLGSFIIFILVPINSIIEFRKGNYSLSIKIFLSKLTFYAVIINIVAFSRIHGPLSVNYRQVTKNLLMAGSIIYITATFCATGYIVYKRFFDKKTLTNNYGIYTAHIRKLSTLNFLICPFLLVRMISNVCAASTMNVQGSPSRFAFLFGDYRFYVGMSFTMECICTFWLCCILWTLYLDTCVNLQVGKPIES